MHPITAQIILQALDNQDKIVQIRENKEIKSTELKIKSIKFNNKNRKVKNKEIIYKLFHNNIKII